MQLSLTERDQRVIWHPYTQHKNMSLPIPIVHGKGTLLFDEQGKSYIDAVSSWWVNIHGHAHPYIAEKIYQQASTLEQVIFTSFTHEPAIQLAERLLNLLPGKLSKIFYSDNGSTAVEVAVKMAIQYWWNKESMSKTQKPKSKVQEYKGKRQDSVNSQISLPYRGRLEGATAHRTKILAFKNSYHGDTFGAMSVSDRGIFTMPFHNYLFEVIFIDTPTQENIASVKSVVQQHAQDLACFIYEPLLQGAGGMRMYDAALLDDLLQIIQSKDIICIADEVLTGFGRTGKLFASEYMTTRPDIICLSKGLTGGSMALGVTACSQKIFDRFYSDDKMQTFFHGHSFTANPIACAASLASLDLLEQEDCMERISYIVAQNKKFIAQLQAINQNPKSNIQHPKTTNIRQLGTILAFELNTGQDGYLNTISATITKQALENGIYLRPLGNTVYIMPPYCITEQELNKVYAFLQEIATVDHHIPAVKG